MKRIFLSIVIVLPLLLSSYSYSQVAAVPNIDILIDLAKMRPMFMVNYLTQTIDNPWILDRKYYSSEFECTIVELSKNGYKITSRFTDESDMLFFETPRDDEFYNSTIRHFKSNGFQREAKLYGNIFKELWENSK